MRGRSLDDGEMMEARIEKRGGEWKMDTQSVIDSDIGLLAVIRNGETIENVESGSVCSDSRRNYLVSF